MSPAQFSPHVATALDAYFYIVRVCWDEKSIRGRQNSNEKANNRGNTVSSYIIHATNSKTTFVSFHRDGTRSKIKYIYENKK